MECQECRKLIRHREGYYIKNNNALCFKCHDAQNKTAGVSARRPGKANAAKGEMS